MRSETAFSVRLAGVLPVGVEIHPLATHRDDRGSLTEVFRQSWVAAPDPPIQWNCVTSEAGVLRGIHIHLGYFEYYVLLRGRTTIGYRDTRRGAPTEGATALVDVSSEEGAPVAIAAPPGIAHGIYTHEPSVLLIGVTRYWDLGSELGCHWQDPALGIPWPFATARTSERDASLPPLSRVMGRIPPFVAAAEPREA